MRIEANRSSKLKFKMKNFSFLISHFSSRKAFTLIELLVVISIISVLTGFITVNFLEARRVGRDSQRKSDLKNLQSAIEQYRGTIGWYPYFYDTDYNAEGWKQPTYLVGGIDSVNKTNQQMGLTTPIIFMKQVDIPTDTSESCRFLYFQSNRKIYTLFLKLEDESNSSALEDKILPAGPGASDPANCIGGSMVGHCKQFKVATGTCGIPPTIYNYWVNSPY